MLKYRFAEILLPLNIDNTFTYELTETQGIVDVGFRVIVNFGKNKLYTGIVNELHNNTPNYPTKPIIEIVDSAPIITKKQLQLLFWIRDYYCCNAGEVLTAMLPGDLLPGDESIIYLNEENIENFDLVSLNNNEFLIIQELKKYKKITVNKLKSITRIKNILRYINNLQQHQLLSVGKEITETYAPKLKKIVVFNPESLSLLNSIKLRGLKQNNLIAYLTEISLANNNQIVEIPKEELIKQTGISLQTIKTLADKGIIEIKTTQISRSIEKKDLDFSINSEIVLSEHQAEAYNKILHNFSENKAVLLHGITSSGKTEIYIKLIKKIISQGKQVLYLLPEIAITGQIISRLQRIFGKIVGVYHSRFNQNYKIDLYNDLLKSDIKIIIGVRSSIFLPFSDLGLIIVDEEHDPSYKQQDPDPRYNARDVALILARFHSAKVILGSATPSLESYYNTIREKYKLVELTKRYNEVLLPEIHVVDIKDAYRRKIMKGHFHPLLFDKIISNLNDGKQIILFQNRRGFSSYIECEDCSHIPTCKSCNVSLTFHKNNNSLVCHYCGQSYKYSDSCEKCGSTKVKTKGFGTERIEDEVKLLFPQAKVARLDHDTASSKTKFETILNNFKEGLIDILIGTQMIGKGLDFERVKLVGILNADNMINFPDFRAFERSWQLMAQVSGRSGRRIDRGEVVIQTFSPDHKIINWVINNNYKEMFYDQIKERNAFKYPPIFSFITIKVKHKDKTMAYSAAELFAKNIKANPQLIVNGPFEPVINKISNFFIYNVLIKVPRTINNKEIKDFVRKLIIETKKNNRFVTVNFEIDVDPY
ncbi:MAG: primosomal protein N' [Bacteroidales bacterium]